MLTEDRAVQNLDELTGDFNDQPAIFRQMPTSVSFNKLRKRLLRQVRQAIDDFQMLKDQKRWLIGLSGGKDSYGLLALLLDLQWRGLFQWSSSPAISIRGSQIFLNTSCRII